MPVLGHFRYGPSVIPVEDIHPKMFKIKQYINNLEFKYCIIQESILAGMLGFDELLGTE